MSNTNIFQFKNMNFDPNDYMAGSTVLRGKKETIQEIHNQYPETKGPKQTNNENVYDLYLEESYFFEDEPDVLEIVQKYPDVLALTFVLKYYHGVPFVYTLLSEENKPYYDNISKVGEFDPEDESPWPLDYFPDQKFSISFDWLQTGDVTHINYDNPYKWELIKYEFKDVNSTHIYISVTDHELIKKVNDELLENLLHEYTKEDRGEYDTLIEIKQNYTIDELKQILSSICEYIGYSQCFILAETVIDNYPNIFICKPSLGGDTYTIESQNYQVMSFASDNFVESCYSGTTKGDLDKIISLTIYPSNAFNFARNAVKDKKGADYLQTINNRYNPNNMSNRLRIYIKVKDIAQWKQLADKDIFEKYNLSINTKDTFENINEKYILIEKDQFIKSDQFHKLIQDIRKTLSANQCYILADYINYKVFSPYFYEYIESDKKLVSSYTYNDLGKTEITYIDNWFRTVEVNITPKRKKYIEAYEKNVLEEVVIKEEDLKLKDLRFVISGDLENFPERGRYKKRKEVKAYIENLGGKLMSAVSGKTSYLITNDSNGHTTKIQKAKELGIPILSEEEFMELSKGNKIPRFAANDIIEQGNAYQQQGDLENAKSCYLEVIDNLSDQKETYENLKVLQNAYRGLCKINKNDYFYTLLDLYSKVWDQMRDQEEQIIYIVDVINFLDEMNYLDESNFTEKDLEYVEFYAHITDSYYLPCKRKFTPLSIKSYFESWIPETYHNYLKKIIKLILKEIQMFKDQKVWNEHKMVDYYQSIIYIEMYFEKNNVTDNNELEEYLLLMCNYVREISLQSYNYFEVVLEAADLFKEEGKYEKAIKYYLRIIEDFRLFASSFASDFNRDAKRRLIEVYKALGDISYLEKIYLDAIEKTEPLVNKNSSRREKRNLCEKYEEAGDLYYMMKNFDKAKEYYHKAFQTGTTIYGYAASPYPKTDKPHATKMVASKYKSYWEEPVELAFENIVMNCNSKYKSLSDLFLDVHPIFVLTGFYDDDKEKIIADLEKIGGLVRNDVNELVDIVVIPDEPIRKTKAISDADDLSDSIENIFIIKYSDLFEYINNN